MAETQQTTLDSAGITRTETGEIAPPQKVETTEPTKSTEQPQPKKEEAAQPEKKDDKSLVNADKKDDKKEDKIVGAPEKYADFKPPEGYELDKETVAKAAPIFKELGLSQEGAQKLVDLYATLSKDASDAPTKFFADKQVEWRAEVIKDRDVGNGVDGLKQEVKTSISKAIDLLPGTLPAQFRQAMDFTGAGNHLPFVKALAHWASLVTEGRHVAGSGPSKFGQAKPGGPTGPSAGAMYPHLPSASGG